MPETKSSPVQANELALLRRVAQRDESAVAEFYQNYADAVFRYAYRRSGECYEDAEEITQDTFTSAVTLAATFQGTSTVFTWLCGIAGLRIVDFYRRQHRGKRIPPGNVLALEALDDVSESASRSSTIDDVLNRLDAAHVADVMLECLADDEREALMLRCVEQLSIREISALMKRTEKAVEHLIARAKKKAATAAAGQMLHTSRNVSR
jgi:RNA polymerase sigma-70 factor (ECF subfamily)